MVALFANAVGFPQHQLHYQGPTVDAFTFFFYSARENLKNEKQTKNKRKQEKKSNDTFTEMFINSF